MNAEEIRAVVCETLVQMGIKPQVNSSVMTAKQACSMLGVKLPRLSQIVDGYQKNGERIKLGRNKYDAKKIRQIATVRNG